MKAASKRPVRSVVGMVWLAQRRKAKGEKAKGEKAKGEKAKGKMSCSVPGIRVPDRFDGRYGRFHSDLTIDKRPDTGLHGISSGKPVG